MAVGTLDLMVPNGPLKYDFFSDEEGVVDDNLFTYIMRAQEAALPLNLVNPDPAIKAYALYLAFDALILELANAPSSANLDGLGGASFAKKEQLDSFREKRDEYLLLWEALSTVVEPSGAFRGRTEALRTEISW